MSRPQWYAPTEGVGHAGQHAEAQRAAMLRTMAAWLMGGLVTAGVVAVLSSMAILAVPALQGRWASLGIMMGGMLVAQYPARSMVHAGNKAGFFLGMGAMGAAMGYLMLVAVSVGASVYGGDGVGPFTLILQAGGMTGLTVVGMAGWLWSAPKDLSMVRGAMAVLGIPMLVLMVVSFVFPIGGTLGLLMSMLFVGVSGAGLLYNLNQVLHVSRPGDEVASSYEVALGVIVLFWNLLVLLTRLNRRD